MTQHFEIKALSTVLGFVLIVTSSIALADDAERTPPSNDPSHPQFGVEVKPLLGLVAFAPGGLGGGVGAEVFANKSQSAFTCIEAMRLRPSDSFKDELREDDELEIDDLTWVRLKIGARHYFAAVTTDSWYGAGDITYSRASMDAGYQDATLKVVQDSASASIGGGYRWIWENGFLVRLGGSAGFSREIGKSIDTKGDDHDAEQGREKLADDIDPTQVSFDIGLGYSI